MFSITAYCIFSNCVSFIAGGSPLSYKDGLCIMVSNVTGKRGHFTEITSVVHMLHFM